MCELHKRTAQQLLSWEKGSRSTDTKKLGDILVADQWIILISHHVNVKGEIDETTPVQDTVCQMMSYLFAILQAKNLQRNIWVLSACLPPNQVT